MRKQLSLLGMACVLLTACAPAGPSQTVKIGLIGPLTGDAASLGVDVLNGLKLAVEERNAQGGINGRKIEIMAEDGKCSPADATSAIQKLVNIDRVSAIVGGLCSSETLAAAGVAEVGKVVMVSPGSSSPDVTQAGTYVFRNYPSDALKTVATAKIVAERGYAKMAVISENTDFAQGVRRGLAKDLKAGTIVFDEVVEPGTKDFRSLFARLKSLEFDVFYANPNSDSVMIPMVQQFRELGFAQPILSHEVADSATLGTNAAQAVEGLELITVPTAGDGTDFENTFKQKFGEPQSSIAFAAHSYDAANIIFQAMETSGTDGAAIRDAIARFSATNRYHGVVGAWGFDENGDVVGVPFVLKKFSNGTIVKVKDIPLE